MATDVITQVRLQSGNSGYEDVITRFRLRTAGVGSKDVITRLRVRATTTTSFSVSFAPPLKTSFNPFETIPLTVTTSLSPDTVSVTQISGPTTLVLSGSGQDRSSKAPARLTSGTYTLRATVTKAGHPTATSDYTFTVAAHGGFFRKNGTGIQIRTKPTFTSQIISSTVWMSSGSVLIVIPNAVGTKTASVAMAGTSTMGIVPMTSSTVVITGGSTMGVVATVTAVPGIGIYSDTYYDNYDNSAPPPVTDAYTNPYPNAY